jgi:hypothetical protein
VVVNQGRESPQIFAGHPLGPLRLAQHLLDEDGVHVNQAELEQMQREDRQLLFLQAIRRDFPALPVQDEGIRAVPILDDI